MIGTLTHEQIDTVLLSQMIGRIGCSLHHKTYIVPVSYVYHEGYIYARSKRGPKSANDARKSCRLFSD